MKKTRKLLCIVLSMLMVFCLFPVTAQAAPLPSGTDWKMDENCVLTITSDVGMTDWLNNPEGKSSYNSFVKSVVIDDGVYTISADAFVNCTNITKLTLGNFVEAIGARAFKGTGIIHVDFPASVTSIGDNAFSGCTSLRYSIFQGTTVPSIGSTVFETTNLDGIYVPTGSLNDYKSALGSSYESYLSAMAVRITKNNMTTYYPLLSDALGAAEDNDTITLLDDIAEEVDTSKATSMSGITVTIDGDGHTITAPVTTDSRSYALKLGNPGIVILKSLTLQGASVSDSHGISAGLYIGKVALDIRSLGTVIVKGGDAFNSSGLINQSSGTVDVTEAYGSGTSYGMGVDNVNSGTVNIGYAEGSGPIMGAGVVNEGAGTINVTTATGSYGVANFDAGTVNVTTATGSMYGVYNIGTDVVNAGTITGGTSGAGIVNTGTSVAAVTLNKGSGATCVLDSITVASSGTTTIGALPGVYKSGAYSTKWYTDSAKNTLFSSNTVTGAMTLYSDYYTAPTIHSGGGGGGGSSPAPASEATITTTGNKVAAYCGCDSDGRYKRQRSGFYNRYSGN